MNAQDTGRDLVELGLLPYPVDPALDAYLESKVPGEQIERIELERLALQTATTETIVHSYDDYWQGFELPLSSNDWFELARIPSDYGKITTLREIQTGWFGWDGTEIRTDQWQWWFGIYYLVYTPREQRVSPTFFNTGYPAVIVSAPGPLLYRLPEIRGNAYSRWKNNPPNLTIPLIPGYNLSLFVRSFGGPYPQCAFWNADAIYKRGDCIRTSATDYFVSKFGSQGGAAPVGTDDLWERIWAGTGLRMWPWGKLIASVQDERHLTSAIQARETFKI